MTADDYRKLGEFLSWEGIDYRTGEQLSEHSSFRIGGPADLFAMPAHSYDVVKLVDYCRSRQIRFFAVGRGSNLLFDDRGFRGVVISLAMIDGIERMGDGTDIECGCGTYLGKACAYARDNGLSGMERLFGIPGSVGGAVYMNAGAYGGEIGDVCVSVEALDSDGNTVVFDREKCGFGYRRSVFMSGDYIILSAHFDLKYGDKAEIGAEMTRVVEQRSLRQPLNFPSAGSAFKRPEGDYASRLIDVCGLKGLRVGGAQVSEKHAGFIINRGGATSRDVLELIERVRNEVLRQTGIALEPEVEYLREK
ncbi:MAG: UDP-N-acetylmuramate dehydrogenase [Clostridia bacterium]|nr:UDP-N-acetylmuramate dehydrogenase [Clostridia bacterium]